MTMTLPNFFILGAARAATSSLYFYLKEHPEIFMSPVKEAQFFGFFDTPEQAHRTHYKTLEDYAALFKDVKDEKIIGEATPTYLALPESAASIHKYCPDAQLLASLRNPVDRAFSYYEMELSKGHRSKMSFEEWIDGNSFWLEQVQYHDSLKRYIDLFGKERLKIVLFEDIHNKPADVIADIHRFLGVTEIRPDTDPVAFNRGGKPKNLLGAMIYRATTNRGINRALRPIVPQWGIKLVHAVRNRAVKPGQMSAETRRRLQSHFREDINRTQELIQRDLGGWLEG